MADSIIVSELLCFVVNNCGKTHVKNMKDVIVDFYSPEEIADAKEILYAELIKLKVDSLSRKKRRQGDNKGDKACGDLMDYVALADEQGILSSLPMFVAANLDRVPTIQPQQMDICSLLKKLVDLEIRVSKHDELLRGPQLHSVTMGGQVAETEQPTMPAADGVGAQEACDTADAAKTWSSMAAEASNDDREWHYPNRHKPKQKPQPSVPVVPKVRVRGKRSDSTTIQSVPRRAVLAAYVGRLQPDTTEEALTKYLIDEGMAGVVCRKLKAKDGKVFKTAAFYVTCALESAELFYDEARWPDGVELRDWVYR